MGVMMTTFILWKWQDDKWQSKYNAEHVHIAADMIRRNYHKPHRIVCITDDATGIRNDIEIMPMWKHAAEFGHCYRRLFAFSQEFAEMMSGKIVSVDLDCVITGDLTELIDSVDKFAIMKDFQPPQPYNGSFWVLKTGSLPQVWDRFIANPEQMIENAKKAGYCACDQAAMAYILGTNQRVLDESDGFYSYKYAIKRNHGGKLPKNAKFIAFHGKPEVTDDEPQKLEWVRYYYRQSKRSSANTKRAIIIGGGKNVWQEFNDLGSVKDDAAIIAINDAGYVYPYQLDYWVTLHPEKFSKWKAQRQASGFDMGFISIGYGAPKDNFYQYFTDEMSDDWGGSSGLFAVKVAIEKGFDEIILCGVPMNGDINAFRGKEWTEFETYRQGWKNKLDLLRGRVYSQSGWTRELLGEFNG